MKKMRRFLLIAALASILTFLLCLAAGAETYSGNCGEAGDNLIWTFDTETGELVISGEGMMKNYSFLHNYQAPWVNYNYSGPLDVKKVTIEEGVRNVGSCAFCDCRMLEEISLPESLVIIGNDAFAGCSSLTAIEIPKQVLSIGNGLFGIAPNGSCDSLASIVVEEGNATYHSAGNCLIQTATKVLVAGCKNSVIPDDGSVTEIGNAAFAGCVGLQTLAIPACVERIGEAAFDGCSNLSDVEIPNGVTNIYAYTFRGCSSLANVKIPDHVTSVQNYAFHGTAIAELHISETLTQLGFGVFGGCNELSSVTVDENNPVYHSVNNCIVETSTQTLLVGCKNSIIPTDGSVTAIGREAFSGCSALKSLTIPETVTSIGMSAFEASGLSEIVIPESVTSIGLDAFDQCTGLRKIVFLSKTVEIYASSSTVVPNGTFLFGYVGSTAEAYATRYNKFFVDIENPVDIAFSGTCGGEGDGSNLTWKITTNGELVISGAGKMSPYFYYPYEGLWQQGTHPAYIKEITIENGVTSIGNKAFFSCSNIEKVTLPDSLTTIASGAFEYCQSLEEITIPAYVRTIDSGAFFSCTALKKITFLNPLTEIDGVLDEGATIYGYDGSTAEAYATQYNREFVSLGAFVGVVAEGVFGAEGDNLTWSLAGDGTLTVSGDGAMKNDGMRGPWLAHRNNVKAIVIGPGVTGISSTVFFGYPNLSSITVDENNAYYQSQGNCLIEVASKTLVVGCQNSVIPADGSVTSIGNNAFRECSALSGVAIPEGVTSIGSWAFASSGLSEITLPESLTSISGYAFYNCTALSEITIPTNVMRLDVAVFGGCRVSKIRILSPAIIIYDSAAIIPTTATIYGYTGSMAEAYATKYNREFVSIGVFDGAIAEGVFGAEGDNLRWSLTGDGTLTISGEGAMTAFRDSRLIPWDSYRDSIKEVIVESGVTNLEGFLFFKYTQLSKITLSETVTRIYDVMIGGDVLAVLEVDENNPVYHSKNNCIIETATKTLVLGCGASVIPTDGSVTSIGRQAFFECAGISKLVIPDGITSIGVNAFCDCKNLTEIELPASVTNVSSLAFQNCSALMKIVVDENNPAYHVVGNCLIETESRTLVLGCSNSVLPANSNVISIGDSAFSGRTFESFVLPERVKYMNNHAFSNCKNLKEITISARVENIPAYVFLGCDRLEKITILSPDVIIADQAGTLPEGATIYGYRGSTAEAYATKYNREFVSLGEPPAPAYARGDVNGDGRVNSDDAIHLLRFTLMPGDYPINQNGDMNGDSRVNSDDAIHLLRFTLMPNDYSLAQ